MIAVCIDLRSQGESIMSEPHPHVGIVILNWRHPEHTVACLKSIEHLDYPSYEVVIVDNGSKNGSLEGLRRRFPRVTIIENGRNLGFATGCNIGIAHLLRRKADYILLLNDDTEVAPQSLTHLVQIAESETLIGIVGPKIYYFDRPDVIWSAGGAIAKHGESSHRRINQTDDTRDETVQDVDYVTGCALLIKRPVVETIGLLDERFFAYFEEAEWCTRSRKAGYRIVYVPQGRVWHKISDGERTQSWDYIYLMTRNRLLYLKCTGATRWTIIQTVMDLLRTSVSWLLKPQHQEMRSNASAIICGVHDFLIGHFGPPSPRRSLLPWHRRNQEQGQGRCPSAASSDQR